MYQKMVVQRLSRVDSQPLSGLEVAQLVEALVVREGISPDQPVFVRVEGSRFAGGDSYPKGLDWQVLLPGKPRRLKIVERLSRAMASVREIRFSLVSVNVSVIIFESRESVRRYSEPPSSLLDRANVMLALADAQSGN